MSEKIIGLFTYPWNPAWIHGKTRIQASPLSPLKLYQQVVWYKSRPRTETYMKQLFEQRFPGGKYINTDSTGNWVKDAKKATTIILLYPDATGLGFFRKEWSVFRHKQTFANIRVLTGRRRQYVLNSATYAQLLIRRILERTMLVEFLGIIPFLLLTPIFLAIDRWRGYA